MLCYNQVFAVTFDENFAKATGVNVGAYNMLISVLTAVTIVPVSYTHLDVYKRQVLF